VLSFASHDGLVVAARTRQIARRLRSLGG